MSIEENAVQRDVLDYFNKGIACKENISLTACRAYRINNYGMKGKKSTLPCGFSDILVIMSIKGFATVLFIEVKAPKKECRNIDQLAFIEGMKALGAGALWVNSLDMLRGYLSKHIKKFASHAIKEFLPIDTINSQTPSYTGNYMELL